MDSITIYLLLAVSNLPFALDKKNKARGFSWLAIGFLMGLLVSHIVYKGVN